MSDTPAVNPLTNKSRQLGPGWIRLILLGLLLSPIAIYGLLVVLMQLSLYSTDWELKYQGFSFWGSDDASFLQIEPASLPKSIDVILGDGTQLDLTTLSEDQLLSMFGEPKGVDDPRVGGDLKWYEKNGFYVETLNGVITKLSARHSAQIRNRTNDQAVTLPAKWAEVRKVFGKPIAAERHTIKHHWGH